MPTDWPAILSTLQEDEKAGLTVRAIASKHNLPPGSVHRWLTKAKRQAIPETLDGTVRRETDVSPIQVETTQARRQKDDAESDYESSVDLSELESDRKLARKMMRDGISGRITLTAQQTTLIRLILKDELEPENDRNLYAGRDTTELAERSLVLLVSVLGLVKVAAIIRELSKAGTLDLGLEWQPDGKDEPLGEALADAPKVEEVEQIEPARPQPIAVQAPEAPKVDFGDVQTIGK